MFLKRGSRSSRHWEKEVRYIPVRHAPDGEGVLFGLNASREVDE